MNFGDRLKQLRTQKNLTQPQLAQAIGIEQSYLSKLENDKSVPGADIFQAILRALKMDVGAFLEGVDDQVVHRELRQVPEVANHLNAQVALRVHNVRRWLFGSALAGIVGLSLFMAGYRHLLVPGTLYTYESAGVVHADEPSELFDIFNQWLSAKVDAGEISDAERDKRRVELLARSRRDVFTTTDQLGYHYIKQVSGGMRMYTLMNTEPYNPPLNRYLMLAGLVLTFASLFGFLVEARLRNLKTH